jgi:hypothetical protein
MTAIIIATGSALIIGLNLGFLLGAVWQSIFASSNSSPTGKHGRGE